MLGDFPDIKSTKDGNAKALILKAKSNAQFVETGAEIIPFGEWASDVIDTYHGDVNWATQEQEDAV